jgi:hypothetical protein
MHAQFPWQEPYLQALAETEPEKLHSRLLEATDAIERRVQSPLDEHSAEFRALRVTQLGIQALRDCSQAFIRSKPPRAASSGQD